MVPDRADRVLRLIMTEARNTDAEKSGSYRGTRVRPLYGNWTNSIYPSLTTTATDITMNWNRRTLIQELDWERLVRLYRMWILFLMWKTTKALRDHVSRLAGKEYGEDVQYRCVSPRDHRSCPSVTFTISDGIMPSNEGRGDVLRRLPRRACRHGRLLGIEGNFLPTLAETVIAGSKDEYPEIGRERDFILKVIAKEEEQINKTIDQGLGILSDLIKEMEKSARKNYPAKRRSNCMIRMDSRWI